MDLVPIPESHDDIYFFFVGERLELVVTCFVFKLEQKRRSFLVPFHISLPDGQLLHHALQTSCLGVAA